MIMSSVDATLGLSSQQFPALQLCGVSRFAGQGNTAPQDQVMLFVQSIWIMMNMVLKIIFWHEESLACYPFENHKSGLENHKSSQIKLCSSL